MGSEKYRAGIIAGCVSSRTPGDWPAEVPGLGPMRGGCAFSRCVACEPSRHESVAWSFVRYGRTPLCKEHANALAGGADIPFVREALALVKTWFESEKAGGGSRSPEAGAAHNPTPAAGLLSPEPIPGR